MPTNEDLERVLALVLGENAKMTARVFDLAIHLEAHRVEAEDLVAAYRKLPREERKYRLTPSRFHRDSFDVEKA